MTDEIMPFIELMRVEQVDCYIEIGARHGDTFHLVMNSLPDSVSGMAVDLGGGPWGNPKSVSVLRRAVTDLWESGHDVKLALGDSRSPDVIGQVYDFAAGAKKVAVFIDGDHTLPGVSADWANYERIAHIVGFHDIIGDGEKDGEGRPVEVPQFWRQLKTGPDTYVEYVAKDSTMGIGAVIR